jgi:hypothetical protein
MGRAVGHGLGWLEFFDEVPEPRQKAKVLYPLPELLLCCLVGVLCGAEGWVKVEEYGEAKLDFLRRFLPFEHGIPSHDTFSDVFNALDPEGFKAAFVAWTAAQQENIREIVAIKPAPAKAGGKTLRRSFDRSAGHGPIHMISAGAAGQRLVLGQLAVGAKDNEITAIPDLLALLTLKGAIVTIGAIGCQKRIAAAICQKGADYRLALRSLPRRRPGRTSRPSIAMLLISSPGGGRASIDGVLHMGYTPALSKRSGRWRHHDQSGGCAAPNPRNRTRSTFASAPATACAAAAYSD